MALAAVVAVPSAATAAASAMIEPLDAAADVNDGAASRAHVAVQRLAAAVGALVDAVQRGEANAAAAAKVASKSEGTANCRHKWLQLVQRHADGMLHCDELVSRCLAEDAVWIAARTHEVLKELISHHERRRTGGLAAALAWASIHYVKSNHKNPYHSILLFALYVMTSCQRNRYVIAQRARAEAWNPALRP